MDGGGDDEGRSFPTALSLTSFLPPPSPPPSPPAYFDSQGEIPVLLHPDTSLVSLVQDTRNPVPMTPLSSTIHPSLTSLPGSLGKKPSPLQRSRSLGHWAPPPPTYFCPDPESPPSSPSASSSVTDLTGLSAARLNPSRPSVNSRASLDDLGVATSLAWQASQLRETVVELWIDQVRFLMSSIACPNLTRSQEGFRAIKPQFVLARCVASNSPSGRAEFLPRVRQAYNFHYSPLDALPVLRRLTLNGSQSYDHISRQASLNLKGNGVYVLNGCERKGKSTWSFEYVVQDRLARTGKVMKGEKVGCSSDHPEMLTLQQVLIPLGFSCSPEILYPENGKRIRLLHVMRKKVVPKLSSWKLEPPPHTKGQSQNHTRERSGGSGSSFLGNFFRKNKDSPISGDEMDIGPEAGYDYMHDQELDMDLDPNPPEPEPELELVHKPAMQVFPSSGSTDETLHTYFRSRHSFQRNRSASSIFNSLPMISSGRRSRAQSSHG
jgi:hypothetical protein